MDLEPLWNVLREEEQIDLEDAISKAKLSPYEARMAVREVLTDFTIKWRTIQRVHKLLWVKKHKKELKELANSKLFGHIILLEKCENSEVTPEGLDLHLWWEKFRYCKSVSSESPIFDVNNPFPVIQPLTYTSLLEMRMDNHGKLP
jgi:hypothetical protein